MREVIPGKLWLGNAADARKLDLILDAGIAAVVDLALEELAPPLPRSTVYCRFPVVDGEQGCQPILRTAIETVASLVKKEIPTLVFCRAGMSRSPSVVAAALSLVQGGSPNDWLARVVQGFPHDVSAEFWATVQAVCAEIGQCR